MAHKKSCYQKGSVELRNGQWSLRYRELDHAAGRWMWRRERLGEFKSKKAARLAASPLIQEVNKRNNNPEIAIALELPKPARDKAVTFRQFVKTRWNTYTVTENHQPSTLSSHGSLIKTHLLPFFGDKMMIDISPDDMSDFRESVSKKAGNTQLNLYGLLRLMFDLAIQYDLIERSPVRAKIHKPQFEKVEKPTLNPAQIQAVLRGLPDQERLFSLLIATSGMRMGEALALRWMDFSKAERAISVFHTLFRLQLKCPKTESSLRTLKLAPAIASLITEHKQKSSFQDDVDFIFCRPNGKPLNATVLRTHLYEAMDAAGIRRTKGQYGYHIFRHSAGTLIYNQSRDLKLVQGTLGHSDISTTSDIYVHLDDEVLAEGTEILASKILENCDLFVTCESDLVN